MINPVIAIKTAARNMPIEFLDLIRIKKLIAVKKKNISSTKTTYVIRFEKVFQKTNRTMVHADWKMIAHTGVP